MKEGENLIVSVMPDFTDTSLLKRNRWEAQFQEIKFKHPVSRYIEIKNFTPLSKVPKAQIRSWCRQGLTGRTTRATVQGTSVMFFELESDALAFLMNWGWGGISKR